MDQRSSRRSFIQNARLPRRTVHNRLRLEELESRTLLSVSAVMDSIAYPNISWAIPASVVTNAAPPPFAPIQFQTAYGVNNFMFGTVKGDGTGQTIALVDAFNQPNIVADLAHFDTSYGLPAPPSFRVVNQAGGTRLPRANRSWGLEESLDVEWAHSIAPGAKLILVEASTASTTNLFKAAATASKIAGVSAVSMSFGIGDFAGQTANDPIFNHTGVTFVSSTGDSGGGLPQYPADSPNVLAVGGTSLTTDASGNYISETGWSGSGGALSTQESEPSYQLGVQSTGKRTIPDVSLDADPNTGVFVYDSSAGGLFEVGGTSLSSPAVAGLIAIANQGRALAGKGKITGAQQFVYSLPASDFHDITSGSNGPFTAGPGYDLVTGIGTPSEGGTGGFINDLVGMVPAVVVAKPIGKTTNVQSSGTAIITPNLVESVTAVNLSGLNSAVSANSQAHTGTIAATTNTQDLSVQAAVSVGSATASSANVRTVYISSTRAAAGRMETGRDDSAPAADTQPASNNEDFVDVPAFNLDLPAQSLPTAAFENGDSAYEMTNPASDALFAGDGWISSSDQTLVASSEDETGTIDPMALAGLAVLVGSSWTAQFAESETQKERRVRV